jgi:cell division septum initiation protein DivIVA
MKDDRGNLDLTRQIEELKKKVREAEGETSLVKAVGMNSPEMRALKAENEQLKADLARAKEDHQYDNLVHQKELESLRNPVNRLRNKGLM